MAPKRKPRDHLERGVTHDIDEAAQRIFLPLLPIHWVPNDLKKDYGKDYHIEITEKDTRKVTGKVFYTQLKGADGADYRYGNTVLAYPMELRYLTYFYDEVKLPVFLVVVDIRTKTAYWLFIQQYLNNKTNWRRRKTFTLHIPVNNNLAADSSRFETEVEDAIRQMRIKSASLKERLDCDIAELQAKDRRFKVVGVQFVENTMKYKLASLQDVPIEFRVNGDTSTLPERMKAMIEKGQQVRFAPGEFEIKGSPLFEEFGESFLTVQIASRLDATATLICIDRDGKEIMRFSEIPGVVEGGTKERFFRSRLQDSPFAVELGPLAYGHSGSIRFQVNPGIWDGQPLLSASYFDRTLAFFLELTRHFRAVIECRRQDNLLFKTTVSMDREVGIRPFIQLLEIMNKARRVASHLGIDPTCEISNLNDPETIHQIEVVHDILFTGQHHLMVSDCEITIGMSESFLAKRSEPNAELEHLELYTSQDFTLPFMGHEVLLGCLIYDITNVRISPAFREQAHTTDGSICVPYVCTERSQAVIRQLTSTEKEAFEDKF